MTKKTKETADTKTSELERELNDLVARGHDDLTQIRNLLAQLCAREKRTIVKSYPAHSAGAPNANME